VAGATQRGEDFLPLPPFRGSNWEARWQRIREAYANLQPLPPIDVIKYDGDYWVVDGHNRVAATRASRGVGLDSMVVELVPLDGQVSERPSRVLSFLGDSGALRAAAQGRRPAVGTQISVPTLPGPGNGRRRVTGQQLGPNPDRRTGRTQSGGGPAGQEADAG
jgi:hypothetical protein